MATPQLEIDFIDQHFAALMNRLAKVPSPELELAAKLVSNFRARGDVCVPLRDVTSTAAEKLGGTEIPALRDWVNKLRSSGVVGDPGEFAPLILDQSDRLYLQRYWKYEDELGRNLQARLRDKSPRDFDPADLAQGIAELFPGPSDLQKLAAFVAATSRLCVISGAPGTGKTRTIVFICALLNTLAGKHELSFALAAPTGKAAARLKETIAQTGVSLHLSGKLKLPADASTIQRLLGARGDSPHFRHNAKNPLTADVVIVDEASMIDLALLAKLFDAIRPDARIILVGDKGQLASVEAGSAFRDICTPGFELGVSVSLGEAFAEITGQKLDGASADQAPIHSVVVELRRNYRFTPGAGIAELSNAVNRGDAVAAIAVLKRGGSIRWRPTPSLKNFERELRERVFPRFEKLLRLSEPAHEPAFALTVHKSQGSEFHDALVILPERDAPVLTRELVYTGITRVRETVEVWASEEILRQTIGRKIERSSGLRERLWKDQAQFNY